MFVQVIQGQVSDREQVDRLGARWNEELRPGAEGFLGGTFGVSDDGRLVNIARFETEEQARRNSDRPEQGAWWNEFAKCLDGEATFAESSDVELVRGGGSNDAGFVQVMIGRVTDRAAATAGEKEFEEKFSDTRPDFIGGIRVWPSADEFIEFAYFTSEAAAREGEKAEFPAELQEQMAQWMGNIQDLRYVDLRNPRII